MFIGIHTLVTIVGNPNSDRQRRPKGLVFGGVPRQRISSQAIARPVRMQIRANLADIPGSVGWRTQHLPGFVAEYLDPRQVDDDGRAANMEVVSHIGTKDRSSAANDEASDTDDQGSTGGEQGQYQTAQLIFFTRQEAAAIAALLTRALRNKGAKALRKLKRDEVLQVLGEVGQPHGVDIALFGRMTTSSPLKNVSAAVAQSHAIGVHRLEQEFDFWTAVDDLTNRVALPAKVDTIFGATTYYIFWAVDTRQLADNLSGDTALAMRAVDLLLRGIVSASPSGMRSQFAQYTRPSFVLIEAMTNGSQPINYIDAYLAPVRATPEAAMDVAARERLIDHAQTLTRMYGVPTARAYLAAVPLPTGRLRQHNHRDTEQIEVPDALYCPSVDRLSAWLQNQMQEDAS